MKRLKIEELLRDASLFEKFCEDMQNASVAVIPTDTLYGFAVAANCEEAVEKVYRIKNRSGSKPLILFVHDVAELARLGFRADTETIETLKKHWPEALTGILAAPSQPAIKAFTFEKIGVRMPDHEPLLQLLSRLPFKLLTTSANRSGDPSDRNPDLIADEFAAEIDWLLDGGILPEAMASTVADFTVIPPVVLRQGKIKL